ncbi:MAG: PAS domain S-box protein [Verrucomicrobia bacterium]|nr:PAS domain S-box protein [Verrucomicrobiota bacterium]MCH8511038.1 PAS domain S-box protein [Kiritimatiellia bacterium]
MKWFSSIKHYARGGRRHSAKRQASVQGDPAESKLDYLEVAEVRGAILDAMPAHMALIDETGEILEVNQAWRGFGVANNFQDPKHGVGANYLEVCERAGSQGSKEGAKVAAGIRKVLGGVSPEFCLEYPCDTATEKRWFRLVVSPVSFGERRGAVVMHVNMTERKLAELEREKVTENLRERVKEQRTLYRIARWLRDDGESEQVVLERVAAELPAGMRVPEQCAARIAYDGFEVITEGFGNDGVRIKAGFCCELGKTGEVEILCCCGDLPGEDPFLQEERELLDSIAGLLGSHFTRRYDRKALEASEMRFRLLFQDVPNVAVQGFTPQGELLYWNAASEILYGYTRAEALGQNIVDLLVPADNRKSSLEILAQLDAGLSLPASGEFKMKHKNGRIVHVFSSLVVIRHVHASPEIFAIDVDLTERKALEKHMLRTQRMESIGTLAGGVAHNLNNMLTPVIVGAELLEDQNHDPELNPVILQIADGSRRCAELVKQLLSFAKGVGGSRVEVDLSMILDDTMKFMLATFPKNIQFSVDVREDVDKVKGDVTQLKQVLLNLCVNARDAMPEGGNLTLTLRNTEIDAQYASLEKAYVSGQYVVLEVADEGHGMDLQVKDRVFEPFFTTKDIGKGTGLGLSSSLGVVRSHGGFMTVYSEPQKGSVFKVYLPAIRVKDDAPAPETPKSIPQSMHKNMGRGECVLVVDDEPLVLMVTRKSLEKHGYRVLTAEDGAVAISLFAESHEEIDLVITDMMMPVMGGQALIAALHRIKPEFPIIATSGMNPGEIFQKSGAEGCVCFLPKPFSSEELLREVRNCLP